MTTAAQLSSKEQQLLDEALRRFANHLRDDPTIPTSELGNLLCDMEELRSKLYALYTLLKEQEGSI